jgi:hypothetical protein
VIVVWFLVVAVQNASRMARALHGHNVKIVHRDYQGVPKIRTLGDLVAGLSSREGPSP